MLSNEELWLLFQGLVSELLSPNKVEVCGVTIVEESDRVYTIGIELCYDDEPQADIDPRNHTRLIATARAALLNRGDARFPHFYHNIPDTYRVAG